MATRHVVTTAKVFASSVPKFEHRSHVVKQRRRILPYKDTVAAYDSTSSLSIIEESPASLQLQAALRQGLNAVTDATTAVRVASLNLFSALDSLKSASSSFLPIINLPWPHNPGRAPGQDEDGSAVQGGPVAPLLNERNLRRAKAQADEQQAREVELQAAAEQLMQYVQPVSKLVVKRARVYADLADLAYDVQRLSTALMFSRHKLLLVRTSRQQADLQQHQEQAHAAVPTYLHEANAGVVANNIVPFPLRGDSAPVQARSKDQGAKKTMLPAKQATAAAAAVKQPAKQRETPLDWFACDNPDNGTRIFAIQGSINLQHWAINLSFDPVTFVTPELGVKVHRGVYETALQLYDELLPLVREHVHSSKDARITFTGHSLGGSVASVLMLLYLINGVIHPSQISPVYTFGSPAVFSEAPVQDPAVALAANSAAGPDLYVAEAAHCSLTSSRCCRSLLRVLGLPEDSIRNVIMHHDIVPRAFVCDYSSVSELLRSWAPAFRHHVGLSPVNRHKILYDFVGSVCVLQPDRRQEFVSGDDYHSMLPPFPHLYTFALPEGVLADACVSLRDAVLAFMNNPHPITMLKDYQSYGTRGVISRYHNPQHYAKALFGLLRK